MKKVYVQLGIVTKALEVDIKEFPCGCVLFNNPEIQDIECDTKKRLHHEAFHLIHEVLEQNTDEPLNKLIEARKRLFAHLSQEALS